MTTILHIEVAGIDAMIASIEHEFGNIDQRTAALDLEVVVSHLRAAQLNLHRAIAHEHPDVKPVQPVGGVA